MVQFHDEGFIASRLSIMRIMARRAALPDLARVARYERRAWSRRRRAFREFLAMKDASIRQVRSTWIPTQIPAELRDCVEVRLLWRQREIADGHVPNHAAAKSADLSHRMSSCVGIAETG
jgi:hypothetical protein